MLHKIINPSLVDSRENAVLHRYRRSLPKQYRTFTTLTLTQENTWTKVRAGKTKLYSFEVDMGTNGWLPDLQRWRKTVPKSREQWRVTDSTAAVSRALWVVFSLGHGIMNLCGTVAWQLRLNQMDGSNLITPTISQSLSVHNFYSTERSTSWALDFSVHG